MHLNAARSAIPNRTVSEFFHSEAGVMLTIQDSQNIQIELCRNALGIVVGRKERRLVLSQIHTDEQFAGRTTMRTNALQELHSVWWVQIADGRAREKPRYATGRGENGQV